MSSIEESEARRKYSRISIKKRQILVKMVLEDHQTIACAARRLTIKPSTARMILNKFKRTGTYPIKNFKKPMKGVCARKLEVKLQADDDAIEYKEQRSESIQEPQAASPQQQQPLPPPIDPWMQYLMTVSPYQAFYYLPGLSFQ